MSISLLAPALSLFNPPHHHHNHHHHHQEKSDKAGAINDRLESRLASMRTSKLTARCLASGAVPSGMRASILELVCGDCEFVCDRERQRV